MQISTIKKILFFYCCFNLYYVVKFSQISLSCFAAFTDTYHGLDGVHVGTMLHTLSNTLWKASPIGQRYIWALKAKKLVMIFSFFFLFFHQHQINAENKTKEKFYRLNLAIPTLNYTKI